VGCQDPNRWRPYRALRAAAREGGLGGVIFVSRVDTQIDKVLESNASSEALALRGRMAIANAKLAYRRFREIFHGEVFAALRGTGRTCRTPAVASGSTKNPRCRDVIYIEEWIGSETVNTLPLATQKAFLDHGRVHRRR
jgi:transaldolase